jgi:hypothetical protein
VAPLGVKRLRRSVAMYGEAPRSSETCSTSATSTSSETPSFLLSADCGTSTGPPRIVGAIALDIRDPSHGAIPHRTFSGDVSKAPTTSVAGVAGERFRADQTGTRTTLRAAAFA